MPIRGLSERRRLPRAGKVRLGVLVEEPGKRPHPKATDYFVVSPEVAKVYGDKPKALTVLFPVDDCELIFPQSLKMYRKSGGLYCAGDGETAKRWSEAGELVERVCPCEYLESGECGPHATLNFFIDRVPGIGVWQLDTGNKTSIVQLNTGLEQALAAFGGLRGIPFILRLEPQETQRWDEQKRQMVRTTIHALRLDSEMTLREIVDWRRSLGKAVEALMPVTEVEPEDRVVETNGTTPEPTREPDSPKTTDSSQGGFLASDGRTSTANEPANRGAPGAREAPAPAPAGDEARTSPPPAPAQVKAERGEPAGAGPGAEAKLDEPPVDISVCYQWAAQCGMTPELYERYFEAHHGVRTGDAPDAVVAREAAEFRALTGESARLAHKAALIRRLNEALKAKARR